MTIACFVFIGAVCIANLLIRPWGIDMQFHMLRIGELSREIARGGAFPVYMFRDVYNHYGYPIPVFYGELIVLPFALLNLAGLSVEAVYYIMVVSILLLAFLSSYLCIRSVYKDISVSVLGAFGYCMQPFFLCELFERASIGSAFVFVFIPMIILGIYHIDRNTYKCRAVICLAVGMSGVITSHVISAVLICLALIVVLIVRFRSFVSRTQALLSVLISVGLCIVLSAWFIFPMLEQFVSYSFRGQNVGGLEVSGMNILTLLLPMHLSVALSELFGWGITESVVGGCSVCTIALCVYMAVTKQTGKMSRTEKGLYITYFGMFISLMINVIWIPLGYVLGFMQFSWRIYIVMTVISALLTVIALDRNKDPKNMKAVYLIITVCAVYYLIFYLGYFGVRNLFTNQVSDIVGHEITETAYSTETADVLYIPENVDLDMIMGNGREIRYDPAAIKCDRFIDENEGSVIIDIDECISDTTVECPFIMYEGYSAVSELTRERLRVFAGDNGLVNVDISKGTTGKIVVSYTGTITQKISFLISLCGAVITMVVLSLSKKAFGMKDRNED